MFLQKNRHGSGCPHMSVPQTNQPKRPGLATNTVWSSGWWHLSVVASHWHWLGCPGKETSGAVLALPWGNYWETGFVCRPQLLSIKNEFPYLLSMQTRSVCVGSVQPLEGWVWLFRTIFVIVFPHHSLVTLAFYLHIAAPLYRSFLVAYCSLWLSPFLRGPGEVLYHIKPYFVVIFTCIGLKNRPFFYGIGTSNQSDPEIPIELCAPLFFVPFWLLIAYDFLLAEVSIAQKPGRIFSLLADFLPSAPRRCPKILVTGLFTNQSLPGLVNKP